MPLIEALSALATLLGTYQVVRGNKPATDSTGTPDLAAPGLVLAYEFARTAAEDSIRRLETVRSRLAYLAGFAGLFVVGAVAVASFSDAAVDLDSVLFLAGLALATAVIVLAMLMLAVGGSVSPVRDVYEKHLPQPDAGMLEAMLVHVQAGNERTEALLSMNKAALLVLSLLFAAEAIILAVWIPAGQ